jgi:hypothetical protein
MSTRYQYIRDVSIHETKTGQLLGQRIFAGSEPNECPDEPAVSEVAIPAGSSCSCFAFNHARSAIIAASPASSDLTSDLTADRAADRLGLGQTMVDC